MNSAMWILVIIFTALSAAFSGFALAALFSRWWGPAPLLTVRGFSLCAALSAVLVIFLVLVPV
jgi:hypothetical protein